MVRFRNEVVLQRAIDSRFSGWFAVYPSLLAIGFYLMLQGLYRPYNVDDPWFTSFAWSWFKYGNLDVDRLFGSVAGQGMVGLNHFGKLWGWVYGGFLEAAGWTRYNAHLVSICLMGGSVEIWRRLFVLEYKDFRLASFGALLLVFSAPFLGAATQARPEAFAFFLMSIAILCAVRTSFLLGGFFALLAVESHPAALLGLFWIVAVVLSRPRKVWTTGLIRVFVGGALAAGVYVVLHLEYLSTLLPALRSGARPSSGAGHFLIAYFFKTKFYRHVPEFLIFFGTFCSLTVHVVRARVWPKGFGHGAFVIWVVLGALLLRRTNFHYTVYVYPLFICWLIALLVIRPRAKWVAVFLFVIELGLGGGAYFKNRHYSERALSQGVSSGIPADGRMVVGPAELWFELKDRLVPCDHYEASRVTGLGEVFYLVEHPESCPVSTHRGEFITALKALQRFPLQIGHFTAGMGQYSVMRMRPLVHAGGD